MEESLLDGGADRPRPAPAPAAVGDFTERDLGDFHLIRKIGAGGMGQVYLARQKSLKREVAVKILKPELAANRQALLRFRAEAEAVARINHANIVQIFAVGEQDGIHYMALEYVDGRNLREYLARKGPPELPIVLNIIRQVVLALQRAHERGFVHRDIKPENILLTRKGEVKVADFGLSRCFSDGESLHLTQSGVTMGTPLYMSPEQVQGRAVDPRSDIYSLGITCWHMLAGSPPFHGATAFEVALQHVQNTPPSLGGLRPDLPAGLVAAVEKMMAKSPEARYQTAKEILRDLVALRTSGEASAGASATFAQRASGETNSGAHLKTAGPTAIGSSLEMSRVLSQTVPTAVPVLPTRRMPRAVVGGAVLGLAFVTGLGIHWAGEGSTPTATETAPTPTRISARDRQEKKLLEFVDNKELKPIPRINHILELILFHIHNRQFDRARNVAVKLTDESVLPELLRKKDSRIEMKPSEILLLLARGIISAHEDKAQESLDALTAALGQKPTGKSADRFQPNVRVIDYVRAESRPWAQALAEAIQRDVRNEAKFADDRLKRYQLPTVVRPVDEVKKP